MSNNIIDESILAIEAINARDEFTKFYEFCFGEKFAFHHYEWYNTIKSCDGVPEAGYSRRVLIEAARGWGKTTFIIRYILWSLGHNHNLRIGYVCGDDNLAKTVCDNIGDHIERNERLHLVFPSLKKEESYWNKDSKRVQRDLIGKDPSIEACGVLATGVGGRRDLIIFDDITSHRTSVQHPQLRKSIKRIFSDVWMKQLLPGGVAVVICTPWHVDDIIADLEESGHWVLLKTPAIKDGESTWPDMWSTEELMFQRESDKASFQRQMQLEAMSGLERSFDYSVIENCFIRKDFIDPSWDRYVGVDLSASMGGKGSRNCIFVIAVSPDGVRHVDQIIVFQGKSTETIEYLAEIYHRTKFKVAVVENNAYQEALVAFIEERCPGMPVIGYRTGAQKFDPKLGVPSIHAEMKNGLWAIEYGPQHEDPSHTCDICVWLEELADFPNGKSSDTVMAMWFADVGYRQLVEFDSVTGPSIMSDADIGTDSGDDIDEHGTSAMDLLDSALEGGDISEELAII